MEIGSNLNLTCIIKQMPPKEDPEDLQLKWTRNDQVASKFALIEMFFCIQLNMIIQLINSVLHFHFSFLDSHIQRLGN